MLKIESPHNDTFKKLLGLTSAKGLKQEALFILSGEKLIREFLHQPKLVVRHELVTPRLVSLTRDDSKVIQMGTELFNQIDVLGTHFNLLVLEQPRQETLSAEVMRDYAPRGIEVVIPTGDPGNLGALIRSCEAFGVTRVILTREAAHPFLPKAVKASAGSILRMEMVQGPALAELPDHCIALDMQGAPLDQFTWPKDGLLLVGEEGPGLAAQFKQSVKIPTQNVESLNAVVAASIALAHRYMQR
jgi:TrmH family RNA methyltransferase